MTAVNGERFTGSITDPTKQTQVYQYLETLKKDEFGWKKSIDNIITNNINSVEEHFLLLQVVEDYLAKRYVKSDDESMMCVRSLLSDWVQKLMLVDAQPTFLANKMAHLFSLVFAVDFPTRWPQFINDIFLARGDDNIAFLIFYLKTLLAIDKEVVDRDIQRTQQVFDRNTNIKDCMRDVCIPDMVHSWHSLLEKCSDAKAVSLCLEVVAAYVDWIDVELIANDAFMPLIIQRLAQTDTSEAAVEAMCAVMQKGMSSSKKLTLVRALSDVLHAQQLIEITQKSTEDDVQRVGSLLNSMGLVLMDCYSKLRSEGNETESSECLALLEMDMSTRLQVLGNEDPDLSQLVVETVKAYLLLIRDNQSDGATEMLGRVIRVCFDRYVMGADINVDGDGEEELEYFEYRKELKSIINTIGSKRPELVVEPLEILVTEVIAPDAVLPVHKVEAVVQLVYSLSELIPSNFVNAKEGWLLRATELPIRLLSGLNLDGRSSTVHVVFFETACRYEKLLGTRPLPVVHQVAAAFLDQRGIAISAVRMRTRIVYLFCRFVKAHKTVLSPLVSEVISRLAPLLSVQPGTQQLLSSEDQGFIFETTATLIVFGELTAQQKADYLRELAENLASEWNAAKENLKTNRDRGDANGSQLAAKHMAHIVTYSSRMSKAFNNSHSMVTCQCVDIYMTLLELFVRELCAENGFLLEAVRQLAHRLVVCLDDQMLPVLPILLNKMAVVSNDFDSMHHLLIFAHQILAKHKKAALSSGVDFGAILTIAARFSLDPTASASTDEADLRNIVYVQRAFLQLLFTTTTNGMLSDVVDASSLDALLEAATSLALGSDQTGQKLALSTLGKAAGLSPLWWERVLRTALQVPSLPHISPVDAGSTLVVHEVCTALIALKQFQPEAFTAGVKQLLPEEWALELLGMMEAYKGKELDKNLMSMYAKIKRHQGR